jgi:hypothetical protein
MPFSSPNGKKLIAEWVQAHSEKLTSMLDIGAGAGFYARLFRKYAPKAYRIGLEIYGPYIKKFQLEKKYHELIFGNVLDLALPPAHCIILGDVLEHMERRDAERLIDKIKNKYLYIIVSVPVGEYIQGEMYGNKFEAHLTTWSYDELCQLFKNFAVKQNFGDVAVFINKE